MLKSMFFPFNKEDAGCWKLEDILQRAKSTWIACTYHADPNKAVCGSEDKGWPKT